MTRPRWLGTLFPWSARRRTLDLARRAAARARELSGQSGQPEGSAEIDGLLGETCRLLDRLAERRAAAPPAGPEPRAESGAGPSATARELIGLRDWVLLAAGGGPGPGALDAVYRRLGEVLRQEGIAVLEEAGPFDPGRQQIVDTRATDDPARHDHVCATVRPGYAHRGGLIRPQEVIVYVFRPGGR
jgi:hypothetical protein